MTTNPLHGGHSNCQLFPPLLLGSPPLLTRAQLHHAAAVLCARHNFIVIRVVRLAAAATRLAATQQVELAAAAGGRILGHRQQLGQAAPTAAGLGALASGLLLEKGFMEVWQGFYSLQQLQITAGVDVA